VLRLEFIALPPVSFADGGYALSGGWELMAIERKYPEAEDNQAVKLYIEHAKTRRFK
jgi:hypothetical protein